MKNVTYTGFQFYWFFFGFVVFISCESDKRSTISTLPIGQSPNEWGSIITEEQNSYTPIRWELGKKLFYDTRLSRDNTLSCASCHKPEYAFADHTPTTFGIEQRPGTRNVPSLSNVAYQPYYLREGSLPTLEMQVLVPIQEHNEFDFSMSKIIDRLANDSIYKDLSNQAYNRNIDPFVITRAISTFERSILSYRSRFDEFLAGNRALSTEENRGFALFKSDRTNCATCHSGQQFTSFGFENNGLYENYQDPGRFRFSGKTEDVARFKIPSLRNVGLTAPYMVDGSLATLDDVLNHYNSGGKNHPNKSKLIRPLGLSVREMQDLKAFLLTLSDQALINDVRLR